MAQEQQQKPQQLQHQLVDWRSLWGSSARVLLRFHEFLLTLLLIKCHLLLLENKAHHPQLLLQYQRWHNHHHRRPQLRTHKHWQTFQSVSNTIICSNRGGHNVTKNRSKVDSCCIIARAAVRPEHDMIM